MITKTVSELDWKISV